MTRVELEFRGALLGTGVVQPTQTYSKNGRLEVLCRPVAGQEKTLLAMVKVLLEAGEKNGIIVHACKRFVLKEGKVVFGWNFAVETKSAKELIGAVIQLKEALVEIGPELYPAETTPELLPAPPPPQTPAPSKYRSEYRTDAQVMKEQGLITVDSEAGRIGRLAPARSATKYELGKRPGSVISMVERKIDGDGVPTIIFEMPLPHVTRELNIPNEKGRGAATVFKAKVGADSTRK